MITYHTSLTSAMGTLKMAASESDFQAELMKDLRETLGAHVEKIAHMYIVGVPDVYCRSKMFGSVWIELKYMVAPVKSPLFKLDISTHQRRWLRAEQEAGGYAGWCLCTKMDRNIWRAYAGNNTAQAAVERDSFVCERRSGEKWDVAAILRAVCDM